MKIIRTRLFFGNFTGLAIYPFIFIHSDLQGEDYNTVLRHELIHIEQQKELYWIGFFVLYFYYNATRGYRNNPFEQEAYAFDGQVGYLTEGLRQKHDWKNYV